MNFRPLTLLWSLSVGLLIYAVLAALVVQKIMDKVCVLTCRPSTVLYANGKLYLGSLGVPVHVAVMLAGVWPSLHIALCVLRRARRHNREKLGQCVHCRCPLTARRGRCPRCGERYETSGRHEPRFDVIPLTDRPRPLGR